LPSGGKLLYLWEDQAWERAVVWVWRNCGCEMVVGWLHSTLRFFDLRYFHDSRTLRGETADSLPTPDLLAVTGPSAVELLQKSGVSGNRICLVEALRYLYLGSRGPKETTVDTKGSRTLVVLTDFAPRAAKAQIRMLSGALQLMPAGERWEVVIKGHPYCPVDAILHTEAPHLLSRITTESLEHLLPVADLVFTSNTTTAAVEAVMMGIPTVVALDSAGFNMSPLRGLEDAVFAASSEDLKDVMVRYEQTRMPRDYFWVDAGLERWQRLLDGEPELAGARRAGSSRGG
jgi:surface carbohydrate biosynthesis protein (TIGR04326 family)